MTPAVAVDKPPRPLRSSFPSFEVRCAMTSLRSLMPSNAKPCASAKWKTGPRLDSWVSLSPNTFDSRVGPNEVTVAQIGMPLGHQLERLGLAGSGGVGDGHHSHSSRATQHSRHE